jgi:hypothetical protein
VGFSQGTMMSLHVGLGGRSRSAPSSVVGHAGRRGAITQPSARWRWCTAATTRSFPVGACSPSLEGLGGAAFPQLWRVSHGRAQRGGGRTGDRAAFLRDALAGGSRVAPPGRRPS